MAYWLFSQMNTIGSFHCDARARPSWKAPMFAVPSPKKHSVTSFSSRYLDANATPAAMGKCPPTIAHPPGGQGPADERPPPQEPPRGVKERHRAAAAADTAARLAVQLGHRTARV